MFDGNTSKVKAACPILGNKGNKEQKVIFLVVSRSDLHFGFACPIGSAILKMGR